MRKRIAIYLAVGAVLASALFYRLYLRPPGVPAVKTVSPSSAEVTKSIASGGKVLIIGVDGMEWSVALDLVYQGRMPNLAGLLEHSAHGRHMAPIPLISPAIWTSVATGEPREVHGIDNFFAKLPNEYREVVSCSRQRRVPALWQMADWAGKSVGVVNWFATCPAEQLSRGVFVAQGIERPGKVADGMVSPASWLERVRTAPLPTWQPYEDELKKVNDPRVNKAYDLDRMVYSISLDILREIKPDLMMTYFENVDVLSHGFWKYRWPVGLDYNFKVPPDQRKRFSDVVELHYEFTDYMIGGLLAEAKGYTVILLSDHGFGASYQPNNIFVDLNKLLERLNQLTYKGPTCEGTIASLADSGRISVPYPRSENIFNLCRQLQTETSKWIAHGRPRMEARALGSFLAANYAAKPPAGDGERKQWEQAMDELSRTLVPDGERQEIDWQKTRAWNGKDFHMPVQGIYINLQDSEPEGIVARSDYNKCRREIISSLGRLRTDRGRPLFKKVLANPDKEAMASNFSDPPDILAEIDREALIDNLAYRGSRDSDPIPLASIRWTYYDVNGDHRPGGVFLISGENFQTFRRLDADDVDIAPTVLWLLGLPVAADMPGRVLREAADEPLALREPLYIPSYAKLITQRVTAAPVGPDKEMIDRMKALGYIQSSPPRPAPSPGGTEDQGVGP